MQANAASSSDTRNLHCLTQCQCLGIGTAREYRIGQDVPDLPLTGGEYRGRPGLQSVRGPGPDIGFLFLRKLAIAKANSRLR